jgi:hypothetical protein
VIKPASSVKMSVMTLVSEYFKCRKTMPRVFINI